MAQKTVWVPISPGSDRSSNQRLKTSLGWYCWFFLCLFLQVNFCGFLFHLFWRSSQHRPLLYSEAWSSLNLRPCKAIWVNLWTSAFRNTFRYSHHTSWVARNQARNHACWCTYPWEFCWLSLPYRNRLTLRSVTTLSWGLGGSGSSKYCRRGGGSAPFYCYSQIMFQPTVSYRGSDTESFVGCDCQRATSPSFWSFRGGPDSLSSLTF